MIHRRRQKTLCRVPLLACALFTCSENYAIYKITFSIYYIFPNNLEPFIAVFLMEITIWVEQIGENTQQLFGEWGSVQSGTEQLNEQFEQLQTPSGHMLVPRVHHLLRVQQLVERGVQRFGEETVNNRYYFIFLKRRKRTCTPSSGTPEQ